MGWILAALLSGAALPAPPQQGDAVFPPGTHLPIRFLSPVTSGRDTVGTPVLVQTMGALVRDSCVVVPAFTQVHGRVTASRGGVRFGRRGEIHIQFDSVEVRRGTWVVLNAVLDTLEYAPPHDLSPSGTVHGRPVSIRKRLLPVALAEASGVGTIPVALLGGYWMARRGPRAQILAGEVGGLRLLVPLVLPIASCVASSSNTDLTRPPDLPTFAARSESRRGVPWDPINLIFLGTRPALDQAFRSAGWIPARPRTVRSVLDEVLAALTSRPAIGAPVSTEYFSRRAQDGAYELAGPNARIRHHVRVWLLDSLSGLWVGAGTEDVGISLTRHTHKINPDVDLERDGIVHDLEATGCADLMQYVRLPGAITRGRTPEGQDLVSDGRTAIVRVRACDPP